MFIYKSNENNPKSPVEHSLLFPKQSKYIINVHVILNTYVIIWWLLQIISKKVMSDPLNT